MATCRDILYNNATRDLTLIAGERGLDRVITWSSSILVRPVNPWNNGGELAFYYGAGMDNSEAGLNELVQECCDANLAGLVILLGNTYVLEIPPSVIQTANKLNFPLFTVDSEAYLTGLQQSIVLHVTLEEKAKAEKAEFWRTLFLEDLRENNHQVFNKAHYFGVDPAGCYCVYIIRFENMEDYVESSKGIIQMDHAIFVSDFLDNVNKKAEYFIAGKSSQIWTLPRQKDLVVIAQENGKNPASKTIQLLTEVCENLESTYPKSRFIIGKGMALDGVLNLRESYIQARRALTLPHEEHNYLYDYDTMGIYKILFNVSSKTILDDYIQNTIYRLREYDSKYDTALFDTLQAYLDNRGNVSKASAALYIHRNTFLQRLAKIESVLEADLSDNNVFYDLQLGMQIFFYLYDTSSEVPFM